MGYVGERQKNVLKTPFGQRVGGTPPNVPPDAHQPDKSEQANGKLPVSIKTEQVLVIGKFEECCIHMFHEGRNSKKIISTLAAFTL